MMDDDFTMCRPTFYHPNVCHTCKKITKTLKMCGKCRSVWYCSKEHQMDNWLSHKDLCKVIVETDQIFDVNVINRAEETQPHGRIHCFRAAIRMWEKKLNRTVRCSESDILMYRKSCVVCNSLNAPIECKVCLSVFYCSEQHHQVDESRHALYCDNIRLSFDLLVFRYSYKTNFYPTYTHKPITLEALPHDLGGLLKHLDDTGCIKRKKKLNITEYFEIVDVFSPVANIVFGLEKAGLLQKRCLSKTHLVVHVISSRDLDEHSNWLLLLEFMFHWITNLEKLSFIVVGGCESSWRYSLKNESSVCGSCKMNKKTINCFSVWNYYHNVIKELAKPDIVAVLNSDMFDMDLWRLSIPCLIHYSNVPLIVTQFRLGTLKRNVESIKNSALHRRMEVILDPQKNLLGCKGPIRSDFKFDPVMYKDSYVALVKAK